MIAIFVTNAAQIVSGRLGDVVRRILQNRSFEISAMRSFHLTLSQADEFFQAYKLVVPKYQVNATSFEKAY